MKNKMALTFALKNIRSQRESHIPYILSSSLIFAIVYTMVSLTKNEYVLTRHAMLVQLIGMGLIVVLILGFIFLAYGNKFIMKRRNKEFALYGILGLEKKHISKIIFFEFIINTLLIGVLSFLMGHLFGRVSYLGLGKIMDFGLDLSGYPFYAENLIFTFLAILIFSFVLYLFNVIRISKQTPIELLNYEKTGEKDPKSKFIFALLGLAFLGTGYYIALTAKGTIMSFSYFFIAVILVMIGLYFLYSAFSIIVLKAMKKNENIYLKPNNFISISSMIYRMKSNAVSLASIAILSTGVIIIYSSTLSAYQSIENVIETAMNRDFEITNFAYTDQYNKDIIDEGYNDILEKVEKVLVNNEKIINSYQSTNFSTSVNIEEGKFTILYENMKKPYPAILIISTIDDYNQKYKTNINLEEDEILLTHNISGLNESKTLSFGGSDFKVKKFEKTDIGKLGIEGFEIFVANPEVFENIRHYYIENNPKSGKNIPINLLISFDVENKEEGIYDRISDSDESLLKISNKHELRDLVYELNGGFLFLGIYIGLAVIIGTTLMIYYKQITEAYDDKDRMRIMKNVGLSDKMINKSISSQIFWIFILPILTAIINVLAASNFIFQILMLFGLTDKPLYYKNIFLVTLVFSVSYFFVYQLTSRTYKKIIK